MPTKKVTTKTTTKKTTASKTTKKTVVDTQEVSIKSSNKNLVIVESPAKAKTIKKFLGNDFDVKASMGHVVDLPKSKFGIDLKNDFEPTYEVSPDKKKLVGEFKKIIKSYGKIWLATDEDREGEAIAFHLANVLGLSTKTTPRIVFHEITKEAIQNSVANPRTLDLDLVDAQQGRRVLDRLVGFKVSPVLWTKIKRGLSAGRVQSVAVKLLVEKEREIQKFNPEEFWKLKAILPYSKDKITITLDKIAKKEPKTTTIKDVEKIFDKLGLDIKGFDQSQKKENLVYEANKKIKFHLSDITIKDSLKNPPAPFITSTLQQEASRRFGWGVKKVMSVAQKLYENGFITYMRTDSVNLSGLAINAAKDYIVGNFGQNYHQVRQYKSKSANAQEAHEAIRPTYIAKDPEKVGLGGDEFKLYSLIWQRTVASQMSSAKIQNTTYIFIPEPDDTQIWTATGEVIKFDGFLKLYIEDSGDDEESQLNTAKLPEIPQGEVLESKTISAIQNFTKPPARYTESGLVKKMESLGIGRPSTYAPTISTIEQRGYAVKQEKKLVPTEIAFIVTDYLEKFFHNIVDYKFTADMEDKLDDVADGKVKRKKMIKDFYTGFEKELDAAGKSKKEEILVGEKCPKCGAELVYKFSKTGKFIGCSNYPDCDYVSQSAEEKSKMDILKEKYEGQPCPEGGTIVVKIGRFGPFLTSSEYPKVKWIKSIPDEKFEQLEAKFGGKVCSKCGEGTMHVKKSKRGYFLACNKYPDCKNIENIKDK